MKIWAIYDRSLVITSSCFITAEILSSKIYFAILTVHTYVPKLLNDNPTIKSNYSSFNETDAKRYIFSILGPVCMCALVWSRPSTCSQFQQSVMFKKRTYARWRVNDPETLHVTTAAISFFKTANLIIKASIAYCRAAAH